MDKKPYVFAACLVLLGAAEIAYFAGSSYFGGDGRSQAAAVAQAAASNPSCGDANSHIINVRCYGAVGDGSTDDTSAIQKAIYAAVSRKYPLLLPAGTYKVSQTIDVNYAQDSSSGFQLISQGATINGASIASAPVLEIDCRTGSATVADPANCFYFEEQGPLTVLGNTSAYAVRVGTPDFLDAQNGIKIDDLIVNNGGAGGGATQLNEVLASDIFTTSVGERVGLALEQTSFSKISGAAAGDAADGTGILLENGWSFSNTVYGMDLEVTPTCVGITSAHAMHNTFISPFMNCATGVAASAGNNNYFVNPLWAGSIKNRTNGSAGLTFDADNGGPAILNAVAEAGSAIHWMYPKVNSYQATASDSGTVISSFNASGGMTVTLPSYSAIKSGWTMGFATDNNQSMTIQASAGYILANNHYVKSIALGKGNYEYLSLQYDDAGNFRVVSATPQTGAEIGN